jgi:glycosyltransferase involved in cell wall biosynthesis
MKKYLKTFLEHLPNQTIFNKLQIVLDHNEPTEEEILLVRDFQKQYPNTIKHIITNPVEPIGVSMNRCIDESDADLIAIWNVDDLRTTDSLEKQAKLLLDNEQIDIANGNFVIVNSFPNTKGKIIDHSQYRYNEKEYTRSMVLGPFFMWKKSLCQKAGKFDEQLKSGADFDLAIRLAVHGKVGMVHGVLGYYLDEGLGASTRPNSKQPLERTLIELRYGIFDKVQQNYVNELSKEPYKKNIIIFDKKEHLIENFVPNYENFLKENGPAK